MHASPYGVKAKKQLKNLPGPYAINPLGFNTSSCRQELTPQPRKNLLRSSECSRNIETPSTRPVLRDLTKVVHHFGVMKLKLYHVCSGTTTAERATGFDLKSRADELKSIRQCICHTFGICVDPQNPSMYFVDVLSFNSMTCTVSNSLSTCEASSSE